MKIEITTPNKINKIIDKKLEGVYRRVEMLEDLFFKFKKVNDEVRFIEGKTQTKSKVKKKNET